MPSLSDSAYPRLKNNPSSKELSEIYTPNEHEIAFVQKRTRKPVQRVGLLLLLKTFQRLGYFLSYKDIPTSIARHVAKCAGFAGVPERMEVYDAGTARDRHITMVRTFLGVTAYNKDARKRKQGTKRSRAVPLNAVAKVCIQRILEFNKKRGFSVASDAPLFPWKNHECVPVREIERIFQTLRKKVGLCELLTPHTLRHYFGTNLLVTGSDLYTVKELLGHASIRSTEVYLHSSEALKKRGVDRLSKGGSKCLTYLRKQS